VQRPFKLQRNKAASTSVILFHRVLEIAIACAARWCKTYLMPEEKVPASLAVRYSVAGSGMQILDTLVKVSRELLSSWPGEAELHLAATKQLLGALVCRHSLTTAILRLESWQLLVKEFAERAGWTKQIASRPERALCKAIVTAAQGLGTQQVRTTRHTLNTHTFQAHTNIHAQTRVHITSNHLLI
jgi:hypothetical protein